jgi:two-component system, LuxR family, response regulator FixJ
MTLRVLMLDDEPNFLESAAWWIESLGYSVQIFQNPKEFLAEVARLVKDNIRCCLIVDVRMPSVSGLQVHDLLKSKNIELPLIYMTGHGDVPLAVEAMQKGALTFLEKPFKESALEQALQKAFSSLDTAPIIEVTKSPIEESKPQPSAGQQEFGQRIESLTPREREVLQLVVDGIQNKIIADRLGISIKTVELHRARVMSKMNAKSISQLMRIVVSGEARQRA